MARNCLFRSKYCPLWCVMTCYFCVNEGLISLLCELSKHFCQRCAIVINAHASDMFSLVDHAENSSSNLHYFPELLKYIKKWNCKAWSFFRWIFVLDTQWPIVYDWCLFVLSPVCRPEPKHWCAECLEECHHAEAWPQPGVEQHGHIVGQHW